jgi:excisionase family DNA binding protein
MGSTLSLLARDLGVHERTFRRAVGDGTIRAMRSGPRRLTLSPREQSYARMIERIDG